MSNGRLRGRPGEGVRVVYSTAARSIFAGASDSAFVLKRSFYKDGGFGGMTSAAAAFPRPRR